ncbi:hydrogen peroxide-inducible genes activator [uncultured Tateyamaria sp.]|uniref:hydrogen peroxide-inducible genes activator n=1 Tax=Tateyamaria sp. 1078 TaxID=3417464 RepID=UPI00262CD783|nr:hydrogen peroxide-inducible genes activator [uncultured Tateyamaria sp.]
MANITLKQLRYFDAVAQAQHFGRAAESCAVSQPALSVQVRDLEETLGLTLFERSPRNVRLTSFGEAFRDRVRVILRDVDGLDDLARAARDGLAGRLRLGVIPTIAPYLLPAVLPALSTTRPGIDVHIRETVTPRLVQELLDGKLDAAIVALPLDEPGLVEVPLFDEDMVLVRPDTDTEAPVPAPDQLGTMRLLLLEEGHCFRDQALSFCNVGAAAREGLDGSALSTLVQMVGAGLGVTLIPEMAVPVEARAARVHIARFKVPAPKRAVGMVWRKTTPMADHLADIAQIVAAAQAGKAPVNT